MDPDEQRHEINTEFDLAFDHVFEDFEALGKAPFPVLLDAFEEAVSDVTGEISEQYGPRAAEAWGRILSAIARERQRAGA